MASYRSGFDPPTQREYTYRDMRTGAYAHAPRRAAGEPQMEINYKEGEKRRIVGQMETRQETQRSYGRPSNLPKPRSNQKAPEPVSLKSAGKPGVGLRRPVVQVPVTDKPQLQTQRSRNTLRRKPSTITRNTTAAKDVHSHTQPESSSPWPLLSSNEPERAQPPTLPFQEFDDYPEPTVPFIDNSPPIIPELDRYRFGTTAPANLYQNDLSDIPYRLTTQNLSPNLTPLSSGLSSHSQYSGFSGYSGSPSTRFSESPGPGPYSRDTTPTSMSSQSPGLVAPLRTAPKLRQASPIHTRPPVTRRRMGGPSEDKEIEILDANGLPSLRESSLTSSSSNSTVKGTGKEMAKKKKKLSPLPPSPPPRKSSQKFTDSPSSDISPSKPSKSPARPVMNAAATSPLASRDVASPRTALASPNLNHSNAPPRRPSRDGTPDIPGLRDTVSVVQSNLAGVPVSTDRRYSGQGVSRGLIHSPQTGTVTRPAMQSRLPSRSGAPSPVHQTQREATPAPAGLGLVPDLRPDPTRMHPGLRTPSPTTAAPKQRFGLFGRRTKTAPADIPTAEKPEKLTRKGPAAGTGHEGYGRYGARGRGNTVSSRDRTHSNASSATSQDSYSSLTAMHDPFLSQRMSPVIIAGGGEIVENYNSSFELARTESNQSLPLARPSLESKRSAMSSRSNLSKEVQRVTLWPSAMPRNALGNGSSVSLASKGTMMSDSDNDSFYPTKSLAVRRSLLRLDKNDPQGLNLPKAIKTPAVRESGLSSQDTTYVSDGPRSEPTRGFLRKKTVATVAPNKLTKRSTSPKKWNFFQRSKNAKVHQEVIPAVVTPVTKAVAYYAMDDYSEPEDGKVLSVEDIKDILREAGITDSLKPAIDTAEKANDIPPPICEDPVSKSSPLPSPQAVADKPAPLFSKIPKTSEIPKMWKLNETSEQAPAPRPSRLAQVGRIPRVVTARHEQTSPKSFSRPFARINMIAEPLKIVTVDPKSVAVGPSPERSPQGSSGSQPLPDNSTVPVPQSQVDACDNQRPFLVISPRKDSDTGTTSSCGTTSSYAGTTAVIPKPDDALEEDEVWDEYDDLIAQEDENKCPPSATSSHGVPFQYERFESRAIRRTKAKELPVIDTAPAIPPRDGGLRVEPASTDPRPPSLGTTIRNALGAPSPSTPMSFTDFISGYGDRNIEGSQDARRISPSHSQQEPPPVSAHPKPTSSSGSSRRPDDTSPPPVIEQVQDSPLAQVNLRVGSLTVSKWLTFGHVLFSPARDSLAAPDATRHHSILVLDGLGNDDWSFYAAETYPDATFYNLSPTAPPNTSSSKRASLSTAALPAPPPNHRQIQHLNPHAKFPFTPCTFSVVVLRFPRAAPEPHLRHLVAEAQRVLAPGGYLELAILDLDMLGMGPKARRAVRGLKVATRAREPEVSLASAADTVMRLLGGRGFVDLKSCTVGVPVASVVPRTTGGREMSLADLMRDKSEEGDEGITTMVAKVGRWWFSQCYEGGALAAKGAATAKRASIFADPRVVEEAERWGTNFKLTVAYAQKPVVARRRTTSA